ncbi:hypothetical protein FOXG_04717 [Fusarium oxysporum f. sp. lycopersici 4287]|uniref:Metallo-beta-lactamase domain-containing protein n=1 Tax=Fusarium oxysporum f. sp. lycopersici (strain 4287 / CBS 123668 / FGSC 9935 / NRRL 34936) TaxID=426428 RepID=A0A0J9UR85_FUSO4|nr:hypothetical protein FOXG_04717 [Fusarium oxysporum f. sp. lycopersici 4287]KNB01488.1 hypothetical protein FOXG_04717 [Fusarium oxysporum f. sp. lycopersici 4287]
MVTLAASKTVPLHPLTTDTLVSQALAALGGEKAIAGIDGIIYQSQNVYHSRSLLQSYNMDKADTAVEISGSQNVSFSYSSGQLTQRIDRTFKPKYWYWASARLDELDYSLVVCGGKDGFACYVRGNNQIWLPANLTSGYVDAALEESLVLQGNVFSPKLLLEFMIPFSKSPLSFDASSHLPHIIRTEENHMIYGPSTNNLYLSQYKAIEGIKFPHTFQTVYNSTTQKLDATLEEFIVEEITINPKFPKNYFNGLSEGKGFFPKEAPRRTEGLSHAHILEFSSNMLWSGPGSGISNNSVDSIKHKNIVPGLPNAHWLIVNDEFLGVKQFVIEFEDHVIVGDAPPQWTKQVIEWIDKNIGKPIKYLWPTHHHRDHSGGAEYVRVGAKLIVPEIAASYWSSIPSAEPITFNETHPYIHSDSKHQAWFIWEEQATHSIDWSYAFITDKCPTNKSGIAVIEADAWHPGMPDANNDRWEMREWLGQLVKDGLPESAYVLPTHGQIRQVSELIEHTDYVYAQKSVGDWKNGGALCKA